MNYKECLKAIIRNSFYIIKLIIPIYIIAEILYFYQALDYISFIVEPLTNFLELPKELSLALIAGMLFNLYAAIAFAAPLDLTPKEWTLLAIYLGICHALIVESSIMKKVGVSVTYSVLFRFFSALFVTYLATLLPDTIFISDVTQKYFEPRSYSNFSELISFALTNSIMLAFKIIVIISFIILVLEYMKSLEFFKRKNISKESTIFIGVFIGITYGASVLINEIKNKSFTDEEIFYITSFLMICHAIIEDSIVFILLGADGVILILFRTIFAFLLAVFMYKIYQNKKKTKKS